MPADDLLQPTVHVDELFDLVAIPPPADRRTTRLDATRAAEVRRLGERPKGAAGPQRAAVRGPARRTWHDARGACGGR